MKRMLGHVSPKVTPQSQPIPGREDRMTKNYAGAYAFKADKWTRLNRFLILGSEGGTYYANERKLTQHNMQAVNECLLEDGLRVIREVTQISVSGRAPKNDQAIIVLAYALKYQGPDDSKGIKAIEIRQTASKSVNDVCRIGTHIFQLAEAIEAFGGWGRLTTKTIADWYNSKTPDQIAFQAAKYQQRDGWSHRDLIRLSHVIRNSEDKTMLSARGQLYGWILDGGGPSTPEEKLPRIIEGFTRAQASVNAREVAGLISDYGLQREMIPTNFLNDLVVWEALLENMPMTAMIRNLGKMSSIGLIAPMSEAARTVAERLRDRNRLQKSRVHPINIVIAMKTFVQGHGIKGSLKWEVNQGIVDALDDAFYASFDNVDPIPGRILIAIDKSGSMRGAASGTVLRALEAAAVMAMVVARKANEYHVIGYDDQVRQLNISSRQRLDDVIRNLPADGGPTDASAPIIWALRHKISFDAMTYFSDGESWAGHIHAQQAMESYRRKAGKSTLFATCDTVPNRTQLHDNLDALAMHCAGFDEAAPKLIQDFISGSGYRWSRMAD